MKRSTRNTAALGFGGVLVAGGLFASAAMANAQTDEPSDDGTPATTIEEPAPIAPDDDHTPPWGDGQAPWGDGETPWGDGDTPFGRGGFGGAGRFGGGPGFGVGSNDLAADLGITPDELTAAFEDGQTLPEIAEANGVDLDELFAQRAADAQASLDEKVAAGDLTQEQADRIAEMIDGFADGETPFGRGGFGGAGRFGGGPGFGVGSNDLAADLGITLDELTAAFEDGQTLPEIAEANGVDLDELFGDRLGGNGGAPWGEGAPRRTGQSEEG